MRLHLPALNQTLVKSEKIGRGASNCCGCTFYLHFESILLFLHLNPDSIRESSRYVAKQ